jgi:putative ABC transport system substrate-binding protein
MNRRSAILVFAALLFWCTDSGAENRNRILRLGILNPSDRASSLLIEALATRGYVVGRNLVIEGHYTSGALDQPPRLATELIKTRIDIIATVSADATRAAMNATQTTIVMMGGGDPVDDRLIQSIAHPGGNVTGITILAPQVDAKRLELLHETLPELRRVAYVSPRSRDHTAFGPIEAMAKHLGVELNAFVVDHMERFPSAMSEIRARPTHSWRHWVHNALCSTGECQQNCGSDDRSENCDDL